MGNSYRFWQAKIGGCDWVLHFNTFKHHLPIPVISYTKSISSESDFLQNLSVTNVVPYLNSLAI